MGFRPVDDSDLMPERDRKQAASKKMRQATLNEEYGNKKKKNKKEKDSSAVGTFFKVFGVTVGAFVLVLGILLYCTMSGLFGDFGLLDAENLEFGTSSRVYYLDSQSGEEVYVATLTDGANREWVDYEKIPKDMKDAFVAVEDERFYKHSGFDLLRTTKATVMYAWGKVTGKGSDFGGSTITQQLIKNVGGDWENSPTRKIKEISQAVNLEKQLDKDEILELYLNVINLSNGCYGVQSAAMELFGKNVSELNLAECASIAGITQNPSYYDPLRNPQNNKNKQKIVLDKMLELGYIDKGEYDEALNYELSFRKSQTNDSNIKINDYYIEYLTDRLVEDFMEMGYSREIARRKAVSGGLKIITTVNPKVQSAIDEVYENEERCISIFGYRPGAENTPQSAMVVLDAKTGAIAGMSGGLGKKNANLILNRATIPRQSGSSIKPISVYAPAIDEEVIHASTLYSDNPEDFNGWSPKNSYSDGGGSKTVQLALQKSSNIIAARVLRDLGISKSYNHLERHLGITSLTDDDKNLPALALGGLTKGIAPIEMAAAYTPFTNEGVYTQPYIYTKVYDRTGKVVIKHTPQTNQAISPQTAYIMTQLLRRVVTSGTGTLAQLDGGIFTAGKTGTTDANKDKWFIGFSPNYICAVWHGYDKNLVVSSHTSGSQLAFKAVMDKAHQGEKIKKAPSAPDGIVMLTVCASTGKLASSGCNGISLPFTEDNKPKKYCSHQAKPQTDDNGEIVVNLDEPAEGAEETEAEAE